MKQKKIFFMILLGCFALPGYSQEQGRIISTTKGRSTSSEKARTFYNEGYDNFEKKNFKKAIDLYKKAIAEDPGFINAYDNLGLTYRQLNMLDSAEHYYSTSFELDSTNVTAIQNLAVVAELQNNLQKAKLFYLLVTYMDTENPEGYFGMARMEYLLGKTEDAFKSAQVAEKYYKKSGSPYIGDCYYILCIICVESKRMEMAKKYLKLAKDSGISVDPKLEEAVQ